MEEDNTQTFRDKLRDWKFRFKMFRWRYLCPIQKNKIVFSQFGGKGYGCNPRAICDEFLKRGGYDLVWLTKKVDRKASGLPEGVRAVSGDNSFYELLTAKVWINNIHFNKLLQKGLEKRKGTIYLNTFHGGLTVKNEGKDKHSYKETQNLSVKEQMYRKDALMVDYITSGFGVEEHVLKEFFYDNGEIVMLGDARTDVLVNGSPEMAKKVRDFYEIPEGTKIVSYVPTFRVDMKTDYYDLDFERVLDTLEEISGCPWIMLIRLHPRMADQTKKIIPKSPRYRNGAKYPDMQELAVASDMMISDYSSVITDFMLTKRPAFLYVPDLENYLDKRGMYFPPSSLPFPYATDNDGFIGLLRDYDADAYKRKADEFLEKIGNINDGKSSERVVDFLIEKMEGKN